MLRAHYDFVTRETAYPGLAKPQRPRHAIPHRRRSAENNDMRKMLLASASLLACALPIATVTLPAQARASGIILVAGEGMGIEFQSELQTAKRAIAAHDLKTAM
jgi:hypothetical protein